MAMQQYTGSSSSSSSMVTCFKKFDVFISFHGKDTRKTFTSHLYEALRKKVYTFIDTELQKGDEISSELNKAIEGSDASVVIFSKGYASSKWCLNELVKILECKRDRRQIVIPVFYDIDPSDVRKQTGTYQQAFEKHERDLGHNKDNLRKWKDALTEAANLSGWNSQDYGMESIFVKAVVDDVFRQLNRRHPVEVNKELVGIEKKYEEMESLLKIGSNDVRTLVLWGMGGIGKTTLAKYLCCRLYSQFERIYFIENIREESTKHGLTFVRNKLFSTLDLPLNAPYVETPIFTNGLAHERSLFVLDDVATLEQAENVNIFNNRLGEGSRVIVTTRDKQIRSLLDKCEIYELEGMNADESLQLFCQHAFGEKCPNEGYDDLSKEAILYCRGNPLALKVLGAKFRSKKSKEAWKSELEKLKKIPDRRIHDVLKLSFDDLDRTQQAIFLDIACISRILDFETRKDHLTAEWNACKFYAESGLEVLQDKALIYFSGNRGLIQMHDLLIEMGKEIVMTESVKDPGRRSRLWDEKDVYDVLKYNKGTEVVEVIEFNLLGLGDLYLNSDSFKNMINLRHLHITMGLSSYNKLHFLEGLEWLSDKLKYLRWLSFPFESLPSSFCAEWLVQLEMRKSKLKKLWDGIQRLDNLMILDLSYSENLIEIPDLSRAPNLQEVFLSRCKSLCQLHPSIFSIPKLRELRLDGCTKIESVKNNIHLQSLQILDLSNLMEFSVTFGKIMELSLRDAVVHGFSSFTGYIKKFTEHHLTGCTLINTSSLWFILDGTPSLTSLCLNNCGNLETLPDNIHNNSMLKCLELDDCKELKSLPKLPVSLLRLTARNCINLDTISIEKSMVENMSHILRSPENWKYVYHQFERCLSPGAQVPSEFDFHTTNASLVIPPIPKYGLCGFLICIILSRGVDITTAGDVSCTIYQHTKEIDQCYRWRWSSGELISDHVLLGCVGCYNSYWVKIGRESGGDHCNLSFKFEFNTDDLRGRERVWIKGCGVLPVYDLEDGRISGVEIVEIQSNAQLSDDFDEDGVRRRLPGMSYRCTKCDKFGHNAQSCKSTTQDLNGLKRKKKVKASTGQPSETQQTEMAANQPCEGTETDFFGEISDELISSIPEINTTQNGIPPTASQPTDVEQPLDASQPTNAEQPLDVSQPIDASQPLDASQPTRKRSSERIKHKWSKKPCQGITERELNPTDAEDKDATKATKKKGKSQLIQQGGKPARKRSSERIKLKWFQKPITRPGSNPEQPMYLIEDEGGILTQEGSESQQAKNIIKKKKIKK